MSTPNVYVSLAASEATAETRLALPPADELMKTLTDRKLAEQEQITYQTQKMAEETRKELDQGQGHRQYAGPDGGLGAEGDNRGL